MQNIRTGEEKIKRKPNFYLIRCRRSNSNYCFRRGGS